MLGLLPFYDEDSTDHMVACYDVKEEGFLSLRSDKDRG